MAVGTPRGARPQTTQEARRALLSAVRRGDVATASSLLLNNDRELLLEAENDGGWWTPLGLAARLGNTDLVRLLLSKGADVEQTSTGYTGRNATGRRDVCDFGSRYSPVHLACFAKSPRALRVLLEGGARSTALDGDHCSALYTAARKLSPECVQLLIEMGGAGEMLDVKNAEGETPMMAAVMALLQAKTEQLPRALRATYASASAVIAHLLQAGCDPNDACRDGHVYSNALLVALDANLEDLAMLLVLHGAQLPEAQ